MNHPVVQSTEGVTLVGGAPVRAGAVRAALTIAPGLVAADGGADRLLAMGLMPQMAVGDFDSISGAGRAALGPARMHRIDEQETTDFDKALRAIAAPFVLALGFSGARMDHGLAVLNTLVRHPGRRVLVLSGQDVIFLAPPALDLRLPVGSRLSLFPMGQVTGKSRGLRWPIDGLQFAPDARVGTSNAVSAPEVRLEFDAARMLVIVPRARLNAVIAGLLPASPAPAGQPSVHGE